MCHYRRILPALALQLFYSGVQFAGPMLLNQIVKFISKPEALQTVGAPPAGSRSCSWPAAALPGQPHQGSWAASPTDQPKPSALLLALLPPLPAHLTSAG